MGADQGTLFKFSMQLDPAVKQQRRSLDSSLIQVDCELIKNASQSSSQGQSGGGYEIDTKVPGMMPNDLCASENYSLAIRE